MNQPQVNGLILAGGKSLRMGRDKSLLLIHGQPQRQRLYDLLAGFCRQVFFSCKDVSGVPAALNPIADQFQIDSPLNGILSAFTHDPDTAWLTVAVDMPLVDATAIGALIRQRDTSKVATCFRDSENVKPEPLLTLWESRAYPLLLAFHESGQISPRQFLMQNDINLLTAPDKRALINVNSEEELRKLEIGNKGIGE